LEGVSLTSGGGVKTRIFFTKIILHRGG
jgi:hypothetical protein